MTKTMITAVLFLLSVNAAFAGGWTQKKGSGFYKLEYRFLSGSKFYDNTGEKITLGKLTDMTVSLYGEYGISDEFTVSLQSHLFKNIKSDTVYVPGLNNSVSGIGDFELGFKYKIAQIGQTVISGSLIFGLPTGKSEPDGWLITGDGEYNQALIFQLGHSFYPSPLYVNFLAGFNNRTNGFSDNAAFGIEGGYSFSKSLLLIFRVHGLVSAKNGDPNKAGGFGAFANNQQYIAYGPELVYMINSNWGLVATFESGTKGRNIHAAPAIAFGVIFNN